MNVALVYDRVNKFGGAEQILLALHELYPNAPLYTAVYDSKGAPWASRFRVVPSFLNHVPFARRHHELLPWVTPFAFETFTFDEFDVVISVTSAEAKTIITKPDTLHICYCLTPTRYLWSGHDTYMEHPGLGLLSTVSSSILRKLTPTLKKWDMYGSKRPDVYVAISRLVGKRIEKYYERTMPQVIYPPVDTEVFSPAKTTKRNGFLTVGRLVGYKRMDLLIDAFNELRLPLTIIGDGLDRQRLQKRAGKTIQFIDKKLTETELAAYYQQCTAFVFAGQEDFGIVAGEAQASGKPVLCPEKSGMAEIIVPGVTGEIITDESASSIVKAVQAFKPEKYDPIECRIQAMKFSRTHFLQTFRTFVDTTYDEWRRRRYS